MTKRQAIRYMLAVAADHFDGHSVNLTRLAEDCADRFGLNYEGGPLDDETHPLWEWAMDVAAEYERSRDDN